MIKVLQLCKKFPWPLKDGEAVAVTHLGKAMHEQGCEVTLLSMNTSKHYLDLSKIPADYNHYQDIHTVDVYNHVHIWDAFLNLFSSDSFHVSRFVSADFEQELVRLLRTESFDIVQIETVILAYYIPVIRANSRAKIVLRTHNVEHEIWERIAQNSRNPFKRWYLGHLAEKLRRYEVKHLNDADLLAAITARDLYIFGELGYKNIGIVTPAGLDTAAYLPSWAVFQQPEVSLSFIGSLDWIPNVEGLEWFLDYVWPIVFAAHPTVTFHIAGRKMPQRVSRRTDAGVVIHGETDSAIDFLNSHAIMVAPILSGSGIKVKIIEGMTLGRVVVSTSIGLEGIDAAHGTEILVADTAADFAKCINWCIRRPELMLPIGQCARKFATQHFDNQLIASRLVEAYSKLTNKTAKV